MNGVQLRLAGDGGPADEHRHAPGNTAPDDVLRGAALQDQAVEDHVEQDRGERERCGEPVGEDPEPDDGCRAEPVGEDERLAVAELARHERPTLRALHHPIDVAVDVAVERTGRPRAHGPADERGHQEPQVREPVLREDHRRRGHDQQQLDDAGLGECEVGAQLASHRHRRSRLRDMYGCLHRSSSGREHV